ncbi:MAG: 50S ribosomal protein L20, partial [Bacilli bacterium]
RINAACRMNDISYSKFMHGLKVNKIDVNRKMLSEIAIHDPEGFKALVAISKKA